MKQQRTRNKTTGLFEQEPLPKHKTCAHCDKRRGVIKHYFLRTEWLCDKCADIVLKQHHYKPQVDRVEIHDDIHDGPVNLAIHDRAMSFRERLAVVMSIVEQMGRV